VGSLGLILNENHKKINLMKWLYLFIAIAGELVATSALKESSGFTKMGPSIITAIGYGLTFYFFALALKQIPIGIAYAIWAGVGIILIALIGYFRFQQKLDLPTIVGIVLIVSGVVIINVFSKEVA